MKKIFIGAVAVVVIVLAIFLYPKDAGDTCGLCPVGGIHRTEYGCLGFKYQYQHGCLDCGLQIKCIGIVTGEKRCYGVPEGANLNQDVEMPC
jgi:hypothetical protein